MGRQWSSGISRPGWRLEAGPVPFPAVRRKPKTLAVRLVALCHQQAPQRSREPAEDGGIEGRKMYIPACSRPNLWVSVGLGPFQALYGRRSIKPPHRSRERREARGSVVERQWTSRVVTCHRPLRGSGQLPEGDGLIAKTSEIATIALVDRADLRGCRAGTCHGA